MKGNVLFFQENNHVLTISLVDNKFTDEMFKNFDPASEMLFSLPSPSNYIEDTDNKAQSYWSNALTHYQEFLKINNLVDQCNFNPVFDLGNNQLNQMHRIFTRARHLDYFGQQLEDSDQSRYHLDLINDYVHFVEIHIDNERKRTIPCTWLEIFLKERSNPIYLKDIEHEINSDHDVITIPEILGKDFLTAFYNYDSIEEDVMNLEEKVYFGFLVDFKQERKNLLNNSLFKEWTEKNNYFGKIGGIPVGDIVYNNFSEAGPICTKITMRLEKIDKA